MDPTRREATRLVAGAGLIACSAAASARARSNGGNTDVVEMSLDGAWQAGLERRYDRTLAVPGLATTPSEATPGTLWYKRDVTLPAGRFSQATLTLRGARFAPSVYVDGERVSQTEGGMAPTVHRFRLPGGTRERKITVEIALQSQRDLDPLDASAVPEADRWRNNMSSCLWDSVTLRLRQDAEIVRLLPAYDPATDRVTVDWTLADLPAKGSMLRIGIVGSDGVLIAETIQAADALRGHATVALRGRASTWTPETPILYSLRCEIVNGTTVLDRREQTLGLRTFVVDGLDFRLNGAPYPLRMGSVVWHRWTRDPEARKIAFDTGWFERNVVERLKALGANALRFHLGPPPEALLDLCDRLGMAVQLEWSFFHGIAASDASLRSQWRDWLDIAARHPSVVIVQAWNETDGEQVARAWKALEPLLAERPPLVVCHRDVVPVHKYWWSLFENLGLYYDSAEQFGKAVSADEFGGNYLDGNGDPGGYPACKDALLRFLGHDNTREDRLRLQAESNGRVAEYWRRLGVAGFSPFCILGSREDGSHWYLGPTDIPAPRPKPVWAALQAAYAPVSISLELWHRNFTPGERIAAPLWLLNDSAEPRTMRARIHVIDPATGADAARPVPFEIRVPARSRQTLPVEIPLPAAIGDWRIEARLDTPSAKPITSCWDVRSFTPSASPRVRDALIGVADEDRELRAMLGRFGVRTTSLTAPDATAILASRGGWKVLDTPAGRKRLETHVRKGRAVVLLDMGPRLLGVGYEAGSRRGGPLEGAPKVANPKALETLALFGGVTLRFVEAAEPESCIHPPQPDAVLWRGMPTRATQLWNGYRGGLIVPAVDMNVTGLSGDAILAQWQARGADPRRIAKGPYVALELAGHYAFAERADDPQAIAALRRRLRFLVEDAPSLKGTIDPDGRIATTDLTAAYKGSGTGSADQLSALAVAGMGLGRYPVVSLGFGDKAGRLIISQLLTAGRLGEPVADADKSVYALRSDPIAVQVVLNMIDAALG